MYEEGDGRRNLGARWRVGSQAQETDDPSAGDGNG